MGYSDPLSSATGGNGYLDVLGASALQSAKGLLAKDATTAGTATVSGAGSRWTMSSDLVVGGAGVGTLTITGGGTVTSRTTTVIADLASADGSSVTVSRLGSALQSGGSLVVGNSGAATLLVEAAGTVTSGEAIVGRHSASEATVTGDGSNWRTGDLQVGGDVADPAVPPAMVSSTLWRVAPLIVRRRGLALWRVQRALPPWMGRARSGQSTVAISRWV